MLITRKKQVPLHWVFYAQVPFVMAIAANFAMGAPFLYAVRKFIDNPAAITFLLSIEAIVTVVIGPFCSWLSDRVWTRWGRRKIFILISNVPQATAIILMPFAPNLLVLIALRWAYAIFGEIGSPNQALTMEVVPPKQRGMGAGFFNVQMNLVNLVFWGLLFGRLNDVYFTGPFFKLAAISGEALIFISGGILLLAICFYTVYGMHEVEPPDRKTLDESRRPGESVVKLFFRSFFKDIFGKDLLPLYLLLIVGAMTGVNLGILGPLLYTDQWGYSMQEMGTNIAIGAVLGIFTALLAGWIADRTSKMTVYLWAISIGVVIKIVWTLYVYYLPDQRPSLLELIISGNTQFLFGQLAGVVSFPLILEYVERNRLGTAGAGMGLFNRLINNSFAMVIGFYILLWSILFLPQAGDRMEVVFDDVRARPEVVEPIAQGGLPAESFYFSPLHRPGHSEETSRRWLIRRPIENAASSHKQVKDLTNELSSLRARLDNPLLADEKRQETQERVALLEGQLVEIESRLEASAREFEETIRTVYGATLSAEGHQIMTAEASSDGTRVVFELEIVEPVSGDRVPEDTREILERLPSILDTADIARKRTDIPLVHEPMLRVEPIAEPANGLRLEITRDGRFVVLEESLVAAGLPLEQAFNLTTELLLPPQGAIGLPADTFELRDVTVDIQNGAGRMTFDLVVLPEGAQIDANEVTGLYESVPSVQATRVTGAFPVFHIELDVDSLTPLKHVETATSQRLRELIPAASDTMIRSLELTYSRIEDTLSSRPVFLTVARPVVVAEPADRQYDYFFSVQIFMIVTDFFGIGVVFLILYLEKRGKIHRRGVEEDENR